MVHLQIRCPMVSQYTFWCLGMLQSQPVNLIWWLLGPLYTDPQQLWDTSDWFVIWFGPRIVLSNQQSPVWNQMYDIGTLRFGRKIISCQIGNILISSDWLPVQHHLLSMLITAVVITPSSASTSIWVCRKGPGAYAAWKTVVFTVFVLFQRDFWNPSLICLEHLWLVINLHTFGSSNFHKIHRAVIITNGLCGAPNATYVSWFITLMKTILISIINHRFQPLK